jgi:hypothetical protein
MCCHVGPPGQPPILPQLSVAGAFIDEEPAPPGWIPDAVKVQLPTTAAAEPVTNVAQSHVATAAATVAAAAHSNTSPAAAKQSSKYESPVYVTACPSQAATMCPKQHTQAQQPQTPPAPTPVATVTVADTIHNEHQTTPNAGGSQQRALSGVQQGAGAESAAVLRLAQLPPQASLSQPHPPVLSTTSVLTATLSLAKAAASAPAHVLPPPLLPSSPVAVSRPSSPLTTTAPTPEQLAVATPPHPSTPVVHNAVAVHALHSNSAPVTGPCLSPHPPLPAAALMQHINCLPSPMHGFRSELQVPGFTERSRGFEAAQKAAEEQHIRHVQALQAGVTSAQFIFIYYTYTTCRWCTSSFWLVPA